MKAIVTLISGKEYQARFSRHCYNNWKSYADRHGLELLIYEDLLDHSPRALSRSPAWQKCLVIEAEKSRRYEQVVWIDSDIVINAAKAPNVFEGVGIDEIGAVKDYAYPTREKYRDRLDYFYRQWEALGIHYVNNLTPQEFMVNWGLPPTEDIVQTGVLVASPEVHGSLFKRTYDLYEDKGSSSWNYEMRPLSYEILTGSPVKWLDLAFNVVTIFAVRDEELSAFQAPPGVIERTLCKLRILQILIRSSRHQRLREIHERLFDDSYFLHFAGRSHDMDFLQSRL